MSKTPSPPPHIAWMADSPLALETYLEALASGQERVSIMEKVLTQMRQQLELAPPEEATPTIDQIRAMFARYQHAIDAPAKPISELVSDMREE
jgi:hypothetical protein